MYAASEERRCKSSKPWRNFRDWTDSRRPAIDCRCSKPVSYRLNTVMLSITQRRLPY